VVARSAALRAVHEYIESSGSAFLKNVRWVPGLTCRRCAGIPSPGYDTCLACSTRSRQSGLVDRLGFVTYAWPDGQAGRTMHAYKGGGETSYQLVDALLTYAAAAHWGCAVDNDGATPTSWAYVPSLSGRQGTHPIQQIASRFLKRVPAIEITPTPRPGGTRSFDPGHFKARSTDAKHVILFDDTWTSGGHMESASAALKAAGAETVTGLVVARWVVPSWANTKAVMDVFADAFDPDICPYSGERC